MNGIRLQFLNISCNRMSLLFWFEVNQDYNNMQSKAEKEEHLDMIKNGQLDIIVGTHSLLGSRVVYNNLGLLVVDEEQVCFSIAIFFYS